MKVKLILAAMLILIATPVLAQQQPTKPWMLGVGGSYSDSIYRGVDSELSLMPLISYQGERLFLRGPRIGYKVIKAKSFSLTLIGNYRMEGYDSSDSSFLTGLDDRDPTLEVGVEATMNTPFARVSLGFLNDLQDNHDGHEISLSLSKRYRYGKLSVTPSVAALWQSDDMADYYYGVPAAAVTDERPAYEADAALLYRTGIALNYMLGESWILNTRLSATWYPSEANDSPFVDDDVSTQFFLGIGYRF